MSKVVEVKCSVMSNRYSFKDDERRKAHSLVKTDFPKPVQNINAIL